MTINFRLLTTLDELLPHLSWEPYAFALEEGNGYPSARMRVAAECNVGGIAVFQFRKPFKPASDCEEAYELEVTIGTEVPVYCNYDCLGETIISTIQKMAVEANAEAKRNVEWAAELSAFAQTVGAAKP